MGTCSVIESALTQMTHYLDDVVRRRERDPQEDLVSELVRASTDSDSLTREELSVALAFLAVGSVVMLQGGGRRGWQAGR